VTSLCSTCPDPAKRFASLTAIERSDHNAVNMQKLPIERIGYASRAHLRYVRIFHGRRNRMSDGQRGGKTDQMRQLAGRFRTDSGQIQGLIKSLDSDTSNSQPIWQGPAADRFRGDWSSFKPTMDRLVNALDEAAQAIDKNAQAIDAATS
jgi:WXG100 family type VII secretion target